MAERHISIAIHLEGETRGWQRAKRSRYPGGHRIESGGLGPSALDAPYLAEYFLNRVRTGLALSFTPSLSGESFSPTYDRGQS